MLVLSPMAFFAARLRVVSRAKSRLACSANEGKQQQQQQQQQWKARETARLRWWWREAPVQSSPLLSLPTLPNLSIRPPPIQLLNQPTPAACATYVILFLLCRALFVMPRMIVRLHPSS